MTSPAAQTRGAVGQDESMPDGFLSRWSRRKRGLDHEPLPSSEPPATFEQAALAPAQHVPTGPSEAPQPAAEAPVEAIDPRTGKPYSELTDADMPDIDTLDQHSDLRAFMAGKVSNALRMRALTKVFHTPKFNQVCLCAEYAEDYTNFLPMGDLVPHDLKRAIVREAGKLAERLALQGEEISTEAAQARVAAEFRGEAPAAALAAGTRETPAPTTSTGTSPELDAEVRPDAAAASATTPAQAPHTLQTPT